MMMKIRIGSAIAAMIRMVSKLTAPRSSIGKNTVHSMQSGVVWGYVALVEGMVARIRRDMGEMGRSAKVIATGGLARLIAEHTDCVQIVDANLTLDGLRLILAHSDDPDELEAAALRFDDEPHRRG